MSTSSQKEPEPSRFAMAEAVTIVGIWLAGVAMVALVAINYKGDQSVSLENAIAYVVIGVVLVSAAVLFRDAIVEWIRNRD